MECPDFFDRVEATLGDGAAEPTRTTVGGQCVYEFYHPRVVEALGAEGLATSFNRSGIVWAPPANRLGVELRVPDTFGSEVTTALSTAPLSFERRDHRGVPGPAGEVVTVLHFSTRAADISAEALSGTLDALHAALGV